MVNSDSLLMILCLYIYAFILILNSLKFNLSYYIYSC